MSDLDVRAIFEKLEEHSTVLARVDERVEKLDKAVHGNGRKGLLDRVTSVEEKQEACPARNSHSHAAVGNKIALAAAIIALIGVAYTIFK